MAQTKGPQIVLIESDWNLKIYNPLDANESGMGINRIRLEFKVTPLEFKMDGIHGINRIRLEFKGNDGDHDESNANCINRIRLEFKDI